VTKTVLVVEDDAAITAMVSAALTDEGYQVVQAVDGDAIPVAHDVHPALILLDIHMPQMDGQEVSRRLRADPQTKDIPIVGMSAGARLAAVPADLLDDRLPKPFDLDDLLAVVARWAPLAP
jgi:CheY-like chemotaxis protein